MTFSKLFRCIGSVLLVVGVSSTSFAQQTPQDVLTGDPATACQVILCLSSGKRPPECNPPLERYFSISLKYWSDTVSARRDFLHLCPAAQNTSSANMPALVDAMANGAGQCDAAALNRNIIYIEQQQCTGFGDNQSCVTVEIPVINPQEPGYCVAYTTNVDTYMLGVTYVGEPLKGGHWVDAASGAQ